MSERLTGQALLDHIRKFPPETHRDDVIRSAGYMAIQGGKECLRRTEFYEEVVLAQGGGLQAVARKADSRRARPTSGGGRRLNNQVKVNGRGCLFIAAGYCQRLGLQKGDSVDVVFDQGAEGDLPALILTKAAGPEAHPAAPPAATAAEQPDPWVKPQLQQDAQPVAA